MTKDLKRTECFERKESRISFKSDISKLNSYGIEATIKLEYIPYFDIEVKIPYKYLIYGKSNVSYNEKENVEVVSLLKKFGFVESLNIYYSIANKVHEYEIDKKKKILENLEGI